MDNQPTDTSNRNIHQARFNSEDVKFVAGINEGTLQNWLARGELKLEQQNPGRGRPREYTVYEAARIRFLKKLVDLAFPLTPAFKITGALQQAWQKVPGGHEAYADEANLVSWLFIVPADIWDSRHRTMRFPMPSSKVSADGYVAIWAVETPDHSIREALNYFAGGAVISVNMGVLLKQTISLLQKRLRERQGG